MNARHNFCVLDIANEIGFRPCSGLAVVIWVAAALHRLHSSYKISGAYIHMEIFLRLIYKSAVLRYPRIPLCSLSMPFTKSISTDEYQLLQSVSDSAKLYTHLLLLVSGFLCAIPTILSGISLVEIYIIPYTHPEIQATTSLMVFKDSYVSKSTKGYVRI
ncbi:hypothetical protein F5Y04DRAFT_157709 [Hypomontagnella monticulosa]|nr:hypothetical protein F5Y04DRAFT_157709 [Hypomontagnella monticulosa]